MMPVALASTSAVAYGISDYLGGVASRRARVLRVVSVSYPVSILVVGVAAFVAGGSPTAVGIAWGLASGLASGVAVWMFYGALASGPMSVISPITAILAAAGPLAFGLVAGERPSVGVAVVGTTIAAIVGKVLPEGSWSPDFVATFAHAETVTFLVLAVLVGAVALYGSSTLTDSRTADEH